MSNNDGVWKCVMGECDIIPMGSLESGSYSTLGECLDNCEFLGVNWFKIGIVVLFFIAIIVFIISVIIGGWYLKDKWNDQKK